MAEIPACGDLKSQINTLVLLSLPNTQFSKQNNIWYQILYMLHSVYLHSMIPEF